MGNAGKTCKALFEWGDPRGKKMQTSIIAQEEVVESKDKALTLSDEQLIKIVALAEEESVRFDNILAGAVSLVEQNKLGEVPVKTVFEQNDRYIFADDLAKRLDTMGTYGEWLAESVRASKRSYMATLTREKTLTEESDTLTGDLQEALAGLEALLVEAKAVLSARLPSHSPILRHIKRKRTVKKNAKSTNTESGTAPVAPASDATHATSATTPAASVTAPSGASKTV
jgi:hypothetical protein